jgi:hypothetical protein
MLLLYNERAFPKTKCHLRQSQPLFLYGCFRGICLHRHVCQDCIGAIFLLN